MTCSLVQTQSAPLTTSRKIMTHIRVSPKKKTLQKLTRRMFSTGVSPPKRVKEKKMSDDLARDYEAAKRSRRANNFHRSTSKWIQVVNLAIRRPRVERNITTKITEACRNKISSIKEVVTSSSRSTARKSWNRFMNNSPSLLTRKPNLWDELTGNRWRIWGRCSRLGALLNQAVIKVKHSIVSLLTLLCKLKLTKGGRDRNLEGTWTQESLHPRLIWKSATPFNQRQIKILMVRWSNISPRNLQGKMKDKWSQGVCRPKETRNIPINQRHIFTKSKRRNLMTMNICLKKLMPKRSWLTSSKVTMSAWRPRIRNCRRKFTIMKRL